MPEGAKVALPAQVETTYVKLEAFSVECEYKYAEVISVSVHES